MAQYIEAAVILSNGAPAAQAVITLQDPLTNAAPVVYAGNSTTPLSAGQIVTDGSGNFLTTPAGSSVPVRYRTDSQADYMLARVGTGDWGILAVEGEVLSVAELETTFDNRYTLSGNPTPVNPPTVTITKPDAPGIGAATAGSSAGTAVVNWTAPANTGDPNGIVSYLVTASTGQTLRVNAPATSATITGLSAGNPSFTVAATNSSLTSNASASSNQVTINQSGVAATNLLPASLAVPAGATSTFAAGPTTGGPTLAVSGGALQITAGSALRSWVQPAAGSYIPVPAGGGKATAMATFTSNAAVSVAVQINWYAAINSAPFASVSYSKSAVAVQTAGVPLQLTVSAAAPAGAAYWTVQATQDSAPAAGNVTTVTKLGAFNQDAVTVWSPGTVVAAPGTPTLNGVSLNSSGQPVVAWTPSASGGAATSFLVEAVQVSP